VGREVGRRDDRKKEKEDEKWDGEGRRVRFYKRERGRRGGRGGKMKGKGGLEKGDEGGRSRWETAYRAELHRYTCMLRRVDMYAKVFKNV